MKRVLAIISSPYFWVLIIFFLVVVFLHYSEYIPFFDLKVNSFLGLERHSIERILFLAIVVLAGVLFGLRGGLVYLGLISAAMLPRIFIISSFFADAILETSAVMAMAGGVNWWIESHRREIGRREQALLKLEAVRRELQLYIITIRENEKRLSVLHSITTAINQYTNLDDILNTAVDKIQEVVDIDGALAYIIDKTSHKLELRAYRGISTEFADNVNYLNIGEGFNGWVALSGEPAFIEDSITDPRLSREMVKKDGIGSQYIVPLKSREKVVGTLCALSRSVRLFTREEEQLLILIGTELGVAVEKAALGEESARVGKRYRELFEKANDAIWVQDLDGNILTANQATADYTGYSLDEIIGETVLKFLEPEGLELAREVGRKLLSGEKINQPYEQKVIRKDGSEATIMLTTSLVADEGLPPAIQHISRDVTREKQLQENLRLYTHQITRAQEEERNRIARELHDESIQALIILSRQLDELISVEPAQADIPEQLEKIRNEIDDILSQIRRFTQDLRPPTLDYLGIVPALRELVTQLEKQSGIKTKFSITGEERHFSPEEELLIYRIVQEALRNTWKHAEAKNVTVTMELNDLARVEISDDGKGFTMEEDMRFVQAGKIGLAGMQERADLLGSKLVISSKPEVGTHITLEIPSE